MTAPLPPRSPLPDPPGEPAALTHALSGLGSAAFSAGLLVHLLEPASALTGWTGADADAAAAGVAASASVADDLHRALTVAVGRLEEHAGLWRQVVARVAQLRQEQDEQHAAAARRLLAEVPVADLEAGAPGAAAAAVAAGLAGRETDRAAEHRALLAALADDAAATAAVLAGAGSTLGGRGRPGEGDRVTVALAARLPGWGEGALARRGTAAAGDLLAAGRVDDLAAAAAGWVPYAAAPPFAAALLTALGSDGVGSLLDVLGTFDSAGEEPLAVLLATAAGAAAGPGRPLPGVLTGLLLDPADRDGRVDVRALGMGAVLRAGGAPAALAAAWGGQLLRREQAQGSGAVLRTTATSADPVAAAVDLLATAGDPAAAAVLLADPAAWTTLLARPAPGGTEGLAAVVRLAGRAPEGALAATAGLQALGRGLAPGSDDPVLVRPATVAALDSALAELLTDQVGVVVDLTGRAVTATAGLAPSADAALRGLALVLGGDETAGLERRVAEALRSAAPGSAAELAGGWVAVREHGARLRYALTYAAARGRAVDFDIPMTQLQLITVPAKGLGGEVLTAVGQAVRAVLGPDAGALGPDTGPVTTAGDAADFAVRALGTPPQERADVRADASTGFDAVRGLLGRPVPTAYESPVDMLLHAVGLHAPDEAPGAPGLLDQVSDDLRDRLRDSLGRARTGWRTPGR